MSTPDSFRAVVNLWRRIRGGLGGKPLLNPEFHKPRLGAAYYWACRSELSARTLLTGSKYAPLWPRRRSR